MNIHSTTGKNREVDSVTARVKNTKKEIEQLKTELEKLINLGTQPFPNLKPPETPKPANVKKTASPLQKTPEPPKKNAPPQKTPEITKPPSATKAKSYNVTEARNYIKKQREKRAEQLKVQINIADSKLDVKKQKLRELHQRTIELVSKNVQRAKSKDRTTPVRPDRQRSQEKNKNTPSKSAERPKRLGATTREKSQESEARSKSAQTGVKSHEKAPPMKARVSRLRTRPNEAAMPPAPSQKIDPNFLYPPNVKLVPKTSDIELEKTVLPPVTNGANLNKRITPDCVDLNKRITQEIMTDACLKDSKETQTNRETNFKGVAWLQAQPPRASPYPYNFINTVKRKLQHAINSPRSCVDVAVQNSGEQTPEAAGVKSKEEIRELLIKSASELKSFASHKRPNLDLQAVEGLELVPNNKTRVKSAKEAFSKNLFNAYESESDTSKNIPEISSESFGSDSKPRLSLDKLKDWKLQKSESIKTDTNGFEEDYTSDFQNESARSGKSGGTVTSITNNSSLGTNSTITSTKRSTLAHPREVPSFTSYINKQARGDGDSQKTFKSLLESTPKETPDFFKPVTENLSLRQPSVSLTVRNSDWTRNIMNTITIRPVVEVSVDQQPDSQGTFKSLLSGDGSSRSSAGSVSECFESDAGSRKSSSEKRGSGGLKEPTISLVMGKGQNRGDVFTSQMKNITVRPVPSPTNNVNEIHLKFEAEVRLLNDFNESFKQLERAEKAFENLKNKNKTNLAMTKILQNVDTQTSVITKTLTNVTTDRSLADSRNSSINFSRGSEIIEELNDSVVNNNQNTSKSLLSSSVWSECYLSNFNESSTTNISTAEEGGSRVSLSNIENCNVKNCASLLSLNIFDQLIKDEDTRIQQLKAIIKIREQALLDRTKGELVWLEIQRKQLIETGKIEEASLLKKKQRGILLKREQERNEIKKLKQMQKEASEKRKNQLKQQRNLIKTQLSTDKMLAKITVKKRKERRSMGPLRVMQSCSESIHSETSISLKSSGIEDVLSIASKSFKDESELDFSTREDVPVSTAKRTLSMREAALQKRRKAAEELLLWHRKLLDEERKIDELEATATSVVTEGHNKYKFNGKQLNQLWKNMTGSDERRFVQDRNYVMSQIGLERLCNSARQHAKNKKTKETKKSSDEANYSSGFEQESVQEIINSQEEKTKISSISELIDNFSRIEDEISTLSRKSGDFVSLKDESFTETEETEKKVLEAIEESEKASVVETIEESEKATVEAIEESEKKEEELTPTEDIEVAAPDELEDSSVPQISTIIEDKGDLEEQKSVQVSTSIDEQIASKREDLATEDQNIKTICEDLDSLEEERSATQKTILSERLDEEVEDLKETEEVKSVTDKQEESATAEDLEEIPTDVEEELSEATSRDVGKESLGLEEALESASKIEESLSRLNEQLKTEDVSAIEETPSKSSETKQKKNQQIDVKKRVSEILADASPSRGDKSPRLQDFYVTAYDVGASNSPDLEAFDEGRQLPTSIFGSEAEELWRKQLAIEQEIKQLELQQKEQLPYVFMREIPNKPPPPYTPPSSLSSLPLSVVPSDVKEVTELASYSSKVLYKAHQNSNFDKVKFSENGFKLFSKVDVTKICAEFVFNICKDIARDHYSQFETIEEPSWRALKKPQLVKTKPSDAASLEKILTQSLKELFGFRKVQVAESAIIKWGRKKRDHVDEVLVIESQEEESQWTNFDKDELIVKDQVTAEIMKMLLEETAGVFVKILAKKKL